MALAEISFAAAAGAGAISFLSPCVLPLVPAFLCFVAGASLDELTRDDQARAAAARVVPPTAAFVLGFSAVFVALGASASAINALLLENLAVLSQVAGAAIVIFGLHYIGLFRIALLDREARFHVQRVPGGLIGAFVVGIVFAFGWTPCIGPILAAILAVAASESSTMFGVSLLATYALGLGIPFIAAAMAVGPFMNFLKRFRRHVHKVEIGAGALLVITGVLMFTNRLADFSYYLLEAFPVLATIG